MLQALPLLAELYPNHRIFTTHPLYAADVVDGADNLLYEKWSNLVKAVYELVRQWKVNRISTGSTAPFEPPPNIRRRAREIGATWLMDLNLKPEDLDPMAEFSRKRNLRASNPLCPARDEVCQHVAGVEPAALMCTCVNVVLCQHAMSQRSLSMQLVHTTATDTAGPSGQFLSSDATATSVQEVLREAQRLLAGTHQRIQVAPAPRSDVLVFFALTRCASMELMANIRVDVACMLVQGVKQVVSTDLERFVAQQCIDNVSQTISHVGTLVQHTSNDDMTLTSDYLLQVRMYFYFCLLFMIMADSLGPPCSSMLRRCQPAGQRCVHPRISAQVPEHRAEEQPTRTVYSLWLHSTICG